VIHPWLVRIESCHRAGLERLLRSWRVHLGPPTVCSVILSVVSSAVSKLTKFFEAIAAKPKGVRFVDACKAAEALGFIHKGGAGSHRAFARPGEPMLLNFQNRDGCVPPYQARQLIAMIEKYGGDQ